MLLTIDIGNSHTVIGLFRGDNLEHCWRISTDPERTFDETQFLFQGLFRAREIDEKEVSGFIVSSVVPPVISTFCALSKTTFGVDALVVGPGIRTGLSVQVENPREVGADRIVNAVSAYHLTGKHTIVIDLGTATTFDVIDGKGRYQGGAIAPGIGLGLDALFSRTAKLPRVELVQPSVTIGRNTVQSIQSGVFYGAVSMIDGMVDRIKKELAVEDVAVLATGGHAELLSRVSRTVQRVEPDLTLNGLRLLYQMNRS
jgi:type III pantothenate kinase